MGVRTLKQGMPDRYVPVRRMLIFLRQTLSDLTRFAVFKPNNPELWSTLTARPNGPGPVTYCLPAGAMMRPPGRMLGAPGLEIAGRVPAGAA